MKHKKILNSGFLIFEALVAFSIFFIFVTSILGFYSYLVGKSNSINNQLEMFDLSTTIECIFYSDGFSAAEDYSKKFMHNNPNFKILLKKVESSLFLKSASMAVLEISYKGVLLKDKNRSFNILLIKNSDNFSKVRAKLINE